MVSHMTCHPGFDREITLSDLADCCNFIVAVKILEARTKMAGLT